MTMALAVAEDSASVTGEKMTGAIQAAGFAVAVLAAAGTAVGQESRFASFEMTWPAQTPNAIASQALAAAEAVTGRQLHRQLVSPSRSKSSGRRIQVTVPDAPALEITYLPDYGEFRIVDTELSASTAPERDMEQDEAVKLAKNLVEELSRRKLLDAGHYDWDKADIASTWVGIGSRDGKTDERRRIEYRITVRRAINGIELANAGVRIAVHASGRISGIRFGGVTVASRIVNGVEEPTRSGTLLDRRLGNDALQARFDQEIVPAYAKARIAWSRVMYVMPENRRRAVVQPLYVVSYALETPSDDGQVIVSRRKTVGLSLVDLNARPVDLTPSMRPPRIETERKRERR